MKLQEKIDEYLNEWTEEDEEREYRGDIGPKSISRGKEAMAYFKNFIGRMKKDIEKKYGGEVSIDMSGDVVTLNIDDEDEGESFKLKVIKHRYWG